VYFSLFNCNRKITFFSQHNDVSLLLMIPIINDSVLHRLPMVCVCVHLNRKLCGGREGERVGAISCSGRSWKVINSLRCVIFRPLFGGVHLVDLFSELIDSVLVLLAVRCQLNVVLRLSFIQLSLQLRYFRLSPLRYVRLCTTHSAIQARSIRYIVEQSPVGPVCVCVCVRVCVCVCLCLFVCVPG